MKGLPDNKQTETGCEMFGNCVSCKLPICWFNMSKPQRREVVLADEVIALYNSGRSYDEMAKELALPRRTVVRLLTSLRSQALIGRRHRAKSY